MTDKAFEEWKEDYRDKQGFKPQQHPVVYGEGDLKESYQAGVAQGMEEKWIAVEDEMPPVGVPVSVLSEHIVDSAFLTEEENEYWEYADKDLKKRTTEKTSWWTFLVEDYIDVTHWQPLPSPPKANEEKKP